MMRVVSGPIFALCKPVVTVRSQNMLSSASKPVKVADMCGGSSADSVIFGFFLIGGMMGKGETGGEGGLSGSSVMETGPKAVDDITAW